MHLHGVSDGLTERKELDTRVIELIKKNLRLKTLAKNKKEKDKMPSQPIFINEDPEYCKHLAKFFKGEK